MTFDTDARVSDGKVIASCLYRDTESPSLKQGPIEGAQGSASNDKNVAQLVCLTGKRIMEASLGSTHGIFSLKSRLNRQGVRVMQSGEDKGRVT